MPHVGGPAYGKTLLAPLETLATVEEMAVRDAVSPSSLQSPRSSCSTCTVTPTPHTLALVRVPRMGCAGCEVHCDDCRRDSRLGCRGGVCAACGAPGWAGLVSCSPSPLRPSPPAFLVASCRDVTATAALCVRTLYSAWLVPACRFTARVSSCGLFAPAARRANDAVKASLRALYVKVPCLSQ